MRAPTLLVILSTLFVMLTSPACSDDPSAGVAPDQAVAQPDQAVLDAGTDMAPPDMAPLDLDPPDMVVPDMLVPDQLIPDMLIPDLPPPTCTDSKLNGDETDVDCGGSTCPACADAKKCKKDTDCLNKVCDPTTQTCAKPICSDKVQNGDETDVDCGGSTCTACADTKGCKKHSDCLSLVCLNSVCQKATCTDQTQNSDETDVDCGGGTCPACVDAKKCLKDTDCVSKVCDPTSLLCLKPACTDKVQNGDETDVDCGGATCLACLDTKKCLKDTDCVSKVCDPTTQTCAKPICSDKVQNGDETDVDCGGGTCPACADARKCLKDTDCVSKVCDPTTQTCAKPSCTDKVQNGDETDVDCGGGTCPACVDGELCSKDADCVSKVCDPKTGKCAKPSCTDKVQNGTEIGVDCGGPCPPPPTWYLDGDGDKVGAGTGTKACTAPSSKHVQVTGDCNDKSATIYPGAPDKWGDCVDQDCDGIDFTVGDGSAGSLTVTTATTVASFSTTLTASASAGAVSITVANAGGFKAGSLLMIRTASGSSTLTGTWELAKVAAVSGTTVTLATGLNNAYSISYKARVALVPSYKDLTISSGGSLRPGAWDGTKGGVLALAVTGRLTLNAGGSIDATGLGYRGGGRTTKNTQTGTQGESMAGYGGRSTKANLTGGGGGYSPSLTHACGGGGGYGTVGATGGSCCGGYSRTPGAGGGTAGKTSLSLLLFGGGAGGGGLDSDAGSGSYGGAGGKGGGAVVLLVSKLKLGGGGISANGSNGEDGKYTGGASPGGGGGGAGGSILIVPGTVESAASTITATGGSGGKGSEAGGSVTYGGKGGVGRVRIIKAGTFKATPAANQTCP